MVYLNQALTMLEIAPLDCQRLPDVSIWQFYDFTVETGADGGYILWLPANQDGDFMRMEFAEDEVLSLAITIQKLTAEKI